MVRMYKAFEIGVSLAFEDKKNGTTNIIQRINAPIKQHDPQIKLTMQAIQTTQQLEAQRIEQERLVSEQFARERRLDEELVKWRKNWQSVLVRQDCAI
ncbi:hypothetical protein ACHAW6_014497 [Cyclotella cf. meneghiniana]